MTKKEIGTYIMKRRKSLKVDQPTLAALANVGVNTLVAMERGVGNPNLDSLQKVLNVLGLQINLDLKDYEGV